MSGASDMRRVFFISNPGKSDAEAVMADLQSFASERCTIAGSTVSLDGRGAAKARADRIVVLGGDGTLIGVARSLGTDQIPLIGVNLGKLGFLAEFSLDEFRRCFQRAVSDDTIISRRRILQVTIHRDKAEVERNLAVNDCVIQAGPPFRIIRLGISVNSEHLTDVAGDGLIVCTPSGSTAHNLSAGGPIIQPGVDAIALTPLCPHSLTHRPLVIEREAVIDIVACDVHEGTTAIIDGQVSRLLRPGDRVSIRRFDSDFLLVLNPLHAKWHKLVTKLHWGRAPNFD